MVKYNYVSKLLPMENRTDHKYDFNSSIWPATDKVASGDFQKIQSFCIHWDTVKLPPRPVHTAPPQTPATSHCLRTPTFLSNSSLSTDCTHHLTLREWDLYLVQRKTSSSFEFTLCRSYSSNCRDSCYCSVTGAKGHWPMISRTHQRLSDCQAVSDARNQCSIIRFSLCSAWLNRKPCNLVPTYIRGVRKIVVRKAGAVTHVST